MHLLWLLLLLQLSSPSDLCGSGETEKTISKGEEATLCWQAEYSDQIKWFRVRRAPVAVGLYIHYWKVLPVVTDLKFDLDGKRWFVPNFVVKPDKTFHWCVSTMYTKPETGDVEYESPCSQHVIITVK